MLGCLVDSGAMLGDLGRVIISSTRFAASARYYRFWWNDAMAGTD